MNTGAGQNSNVIVFHISNKPSLLYEVTKVLTEAELGIELGYSQYRKKTSNCMYIFIKYCSTISQFVGLLLKPTLTPFIIAIHNGKGLQSYSPIDNFFVNSDHLNQLTANVTEKGEYILCVGTGFLTG